MAVTVHCRTRAPPTHPCSYEERGRFRRSFRYSLSLYVDTLHTSPPLHQLRFMTVRVAVPRTAVWRRGVSLQQDSALTRSTYRRQ